METYEAPKMEVIRFDNNDVITSSGCSGCSGTYGVNVNN